MLKEYFELYLVYLFSGLLYDCVAAAAPQRLFARLSPLSLPLPAPSLSVTRPLILYYPLTWRGRRGTKDKQGHRCEKEELARGGRRNAV